MEIKKWFLVPSFCLILLVAVYIGYTDVFPFFRTPKVMFANQTLNLEDPLIIHFDRSVIHHKIESSFSLVPSAVGKISWQKNDLVFNPVQPWQPDTRYQVNFSGITNAAIDFSFKDNFRTESLPKVEKFNPSEGALVDPRSPIQFYFNKGKEDYRIDFKVAPAFNYTVLIDPERKFFQLNPEEPLAQNMDYQVIAYDSYQSKDKKNWYSQEVANFKFKTIAPPEVQKIIPANAQEDVTEFEPIKAYFSKSMKVDNWRDFIEVTPNVVGQAQWEDEGKTFIFKPYRWTQNTDYTVKIKGGWQASDNTFLDNDFITSFRSFDGSGMVSKKLSATQDPKIKEGRYVDINLSKQLLSIFDNGDNLGTYKVSSGKRSMATPTGMFGILGKQRKRWSKEYHLFMPYWMQFTRAGHGIHELPEWPSGYKEGANHLGTPVSHGCVRLGVGPAKTVYNFVDVGTPVYIHY